MFGQEAVQHWKEDFFVLCLSLQQVRVHDINRRVRRELERKSRHSLVTSFPYLSEFSLLLPDHTAAQLDSTRSRQSFVSWSLCYFLHSASQGNVRAQDVSAQHEKNMCDTRFNLAKRGVKTAHMSCNSHSPHLFMFYIIFASHPFWIQKAYFLFELAADGWIQLSLYQEV